MFNADGVRLFEEWLATELARTSDTAFAREFSEHIELPGVHEDDYLHRLIRTRHGNLLGGIRFYGRDIARPFVEIIAHSFIDLDRLRSCVAHEWAMFAPGALRLITSPASTHDRHALLDKTIHAARCQDLRAPAAQVVLHPFDRLQDAIDIVDTRYRELPTDLRRNVSPATNIEMRDWHDCGHLHAVHAAGMIVGALAVAPGQIYWIEGEEICEEVITSRYGGHGYAADAQAFWAAHRAPDRDRYLVGTIDRLNAVSRRTAESAGRARVLDMVFVGLGPAEQDCSIDSEHTAHWPGRYR